MSFEQSISMRSARRRWSGVEGLTTGAMPHGERSEAITGGALPELLTAASLRIGSGRDRDCHGLDGLAMVLAHQGKRIEAIPIALPEA
jgi:hypothetical protein